MIRIFLLSIENSHKFQTVHSYLHDKIFFSVYDNSKYSGIIENIYAGSFRTKMEDGKVIVKKVIIREDNEPEVVKKDLHPQIPEDVRMLVTGILHKGEKSFVRVSFLRGKAWAEGIVPDTRIEKSEGFTEEEIKGLETYLLEQKDMIIQQAKGVNPLRNMFGIS